jgi:hypothetical protein
MNHPMERVIFSTQRKRILKINNTNEKIMILGASILQLPAILKAKEMGFELLLLI